MIHELIIQMANSIKGDKQLRHVYHSNNLQGWDLPSIVQTTFDISEFQRIQNADMYGKKGDLSISWVRLDFERYVYAGFYRNGQDPVEGIDSLNRKGLDYKTEKVANEYDSLIGKLIITLDGYVGQTYVRVTQEKLPKILSETIQSSASVYLGHDKVILSYQELKTVVNDPAYVDAWSHVWAVYRWVNKINGKQYIGSASGKKGLLQRMQGYANWNHGNVGLSEAFSNVKDRDNLVMSIIYAVDQDYISRKEILEKEYREIDKNMTGIHGYNHSGLAEDERRNKELKEITN